MSAVALALLLPLAASIPVARAAPAPAAATASPGDLLLPCTVVPHDTLIGLNRTLFAAPGAWKDVARINHLPDSNRIDPGQVLQVPARYLHSKVVPAQVLSAFGDVRIADRPASAGATLDVGATIRTGEASSAVVQLADGSRIKLAPDSQGRLDEQRRFQVKAAAAAVDDGLVAASLRLISGSVEVFASKVLRARPLEVSTPTAVIGVRGTVYRVRHAVTPATATASAVNVSATEVLEGKVHAQVGASAAQAADVPAGFGAPLEDGRKPVALPLPPAPDLSAVPALFDHLPIRFPVPGVLRVRVQVANDAAFDHIQYDQHFDAGDDVYIPQLADGPWHLRIRAIGPEGLEGLDARRDFRLLARPEAPFLTEPPAGGKRPVGDVTLRWTHNPDAAGFVVEVARDARFTQIALHDEHVRGDTAVFHPTDSAFGAADGLYWWRVLSVATDGRRGAWSEPQALVLRPTPRAPLGQVSPDGAAIELRWGGRPEDRAEAELARDAAFQQIVTRGDYETPGARLPRPAAGTYFARYRFVEPDGFKTSWSAPVKIEVASSWHRALGALLPASWPR
ncbi:MAG: FecR domain-containing protein [Burkholderiales bacterium]|nr:FecR domain-containing protein [Burkholderiales bacterium]